MLICFVLLSVYFLIFFFFLPPSPSLSSLTMPARCLRAGRLSDPSCSGSRKQYVNQFIGIHRENLLGNNDGSLRGRSTPSVFSRGGSLLPSIYADGRSSDDVIAFWRYPHYWFSLKIRRLPWYHFYNTSLPAFVLTTTGFAAFVMVSLSGATPSPHPPPATPLTLHKCSRVLLVPFVRSSLEAPLVSMLNVELH